jgi:hypothetical protein
MKCASVRNKGVGAQKSAIFALAKHTLGRVENKMERGGYTPHENGSLSKQRTYGRSIAQVFEKKSGCTKCSRAFLDGKVGGASSPRSAEHAKEAVPPYGFCKNLIRWRLEGGGQQIL